MATHKKLNSEYYIETTDVYITGNLHVRGAYDTTEVVDSTITDRNIYLNAGEPITNAGVNNGTGTSGIVVERGSLDNVAIRWDEFSRRIERSICSKWISTWSRISYKNSSIWVFINIIGIKNGNN